MSGNACSRHCDTSLAGEDATSSPPTETAARKRTPDDPPTAPLRTAKTDQEGFPARLPPINSLGDEFAADFFGMEPANKADAMGLTSSGEDGFRKPRADSTDARALTKSNAEGHNELPKEAEMAAGGQETMDLVASGEDGFRKPGADSTNARALTKSSAEGSHNELPKEADGQAPIAAGGQESMGLVASGEDGFRKPGAYSNSTGARALTKSNAEGHNELPKEAEMAAGGQETMGLVASGEDGFRKPGADSTDARALTKSNAEGHDKLPKEADGQTPMASGGQDTMGLVASGEDGFRKPRADSTNGSSAERAYIEQAQKAAGGQENMREAETCLRKEDSSGKMEDEVNRGIKGNDCPPHVVCKFLADGEDGKPQPSAVDETFPARMNRMLEPGMNSSNPNSGPEQILDDAVPKVEIDPFWEPDIREKLNGREADKTWSRSGPEQIDDVACRGAHFDFVQDSDADASERRKVTTGISTKRDVRISNDHGPPRPHHHDFFVEDDEILSKRKGNSLAPNESIPPAPAGVGHNDDESTHPTSLTQDLENRRDSILIPSREDIEDDLDYPNNCSNTASQWNVGRSVLRANASLSEENASAPADIGSIRPDTLRQGSNASLLHIPNAVLVEDEEGSGRNEIIDAYAEPLLPWWKQRRTKALICFFCILVIALAVSFGVERSREPPTTSGFRGTDNPTAPPSTSPTFTSSPSLRPSSCAFSVSSIKQIIDFRLDSPGVPSVAVDGTNMVAVVYDSRSNLLYTIFYSFVNGEWVMRNVFQEYFYVPQNYPAALTGTRALVGVTSMGGGGLVNIYEQNRLGFWEKRDDDSHVVLDDSIIWFDMETYSYNFGYSVGIDRDLACVTDTAYVHIIRQLDGRWSGVATISKGSFYESCSISLDIISAVDTGPAGGGRLLRLFRYNRNSNEIETIQDQIEISVCGDWRSHGRSMALSQGHLIYSSCKDGEYWEEAGEYSIHIYMWDDAINGYAFDQQLPARFETLPSLHLDESLLVIAGDDHTRIFIEQDGVWSEKVTLDEQYASLNGSGRNIFGVASKDFSLHSLAIEGCAPTPTHVPSVSAPPTICYSIQVEVIIFGQYSPVQWDMTRVGMAQGGDVVLKSRKVANDTVTSHAELTCLIEGEYEFNVFGFIVPARFAAQYELRTLQGALIAGGIYHYGDIAERFSIPFTATPSTVPSISDAPSSSGAPSFAPHPCPPLQDLSSFGYRHSGYITGEYAPEPGDNDGRATVFLASSLQECASECQQCNAPVGMFFGSRRRGDEWFECLCFHLWEEFLCFGLYDGGNYGCDVGVHFSSESFADVGQCEELIRK